MTMVELTTKEQEFLVQILHSSLATLEVEIRHADHIEFREVLKDRRKVLEQLLAKVQKASTVMA